MFSISEGDFGKKKLCNGFYNSQQTLYEGGPISNGNPSLISFSVAISQNSLHQNHGVYLILPDSIMILTESCDNPCCLATREFSVNVPGHG